MALKLVNRTGFQELPLLVERLPNELAPRLELFREAIPEGARKWRQDIVLTPGTYSVSVEGHPKWRATVTISPKAKQ